MSEDSVIVCLPRELSWHIVALAGVETCAILRHAPAFQSILAQYASSHNRSKSAEHLALDISLKHKWSAGVRALLDLGVKYEENCVRHDACSASSVDWDDIIVEPRHILRMWQRDAPPVFTIAALVHNLMSLGACPDDLFRHCCERSRRFIIRLCHKMLERGCSIDDVCKTYKRSGYFSSERDMAQHLMMPSAAAGCVEALHYFDGIYPELAACSSRFLFQAASCGRLKATKYLYYTLDYEETDSILSDLLFDSDGDAALWLHKQFPNDYAPRVGVAHLKKGHIGRFKRSWPRTSRAIDQFQGLFRMAAEHLSVDILKWLVKTSGRLNAAEIFRYQVPNLSIPALRWFLDHTGYAPTLEQLADYIRLGNYSAAEFLIGYHPRYRTPSAMGYMLSEGTLPWIERMATRAGIPLKTVRLSSAGARTLAYRGEFRLFRWVHQHGGCDVDPSVIEAAAASGSGDLAQWLHETFPQVPVTMDALQAACESGNLWLVQWLYPRVQAMTTPTVAFDAAARAGYLDIVTWLHQHTDLPCSTDAIDSAAAIGRLDIVRFLHENRREGCTTKALDQAAANGHLDVLEYLCSNRTEDCTARAMDKAAKNGLTTVVRWLVKHYPHTLETTDVVNVDDASSSVDIAGAIDNAASAGWLDIVQFLHQETAATCTTAAMDLAAANEQGEMVRWLHEKRSEGCTQAAMARSAESDFAIFRFLWQHGYPRCDAEILSRLPVRLKCWVKKQLLIERQEGQPNDWLGTNASEWLEGDVDDIDCTDSDTCSTSLTQDSDYSDGDGYSDDDDDEFSAEI
ncbi:hypothetical protein RI367_005379 [Sorochytrium milnesiophthora]